MLSQNLALALRDHSLPLTPKGVDRQRIAIVGAGPGGLSAAILLAARGFAVTVFEKGRRAEGYMKFSRLEPM